MKAVLLSHFFPPMAAPRAVQVERLVRHSRLPMRVICAAEGAAPPRAGVDLSILPYRAPHWWHIAKQLLPSPDPYRSWAMRAAQQVIVQDLLSNNDVLVTFGQPMSDHLAGLRLKRQTNVQWIAHFSDPWSDSPYLLPIPFTRSRLVRMERAVIEAADRVLFTSRETLDLVMNKYPGTFRLKAEVLPHSYDPALYDSASQRPRGGPLLVRCLGNFYRQRNPIALAKALVLLRRTRPELLVDLRIELIGRWIGKKKWTPVMMGLPETLLSLRGPVSYLESLKLMGEADALLVIDAPFERNVFFPSKLVDYLGAHRPIVALTPSGCTADVVRAAGGLSVAPSSVEMVAAGLEQALSRLRAGTLMAPSREMVGKYAAGRVAARFDAMLLEMV